LIVIGIACILAGLVFTAQSKSLVGPQSSFMYSNPEWTLNGFLILGIGLVFLVSGFATWGYKKLVDKNFR
jgi:multisubunit Na+/H+ antiporter MnhB subunit